MITDEQVKQACAAYEKHRSLNVFSDNLHAMRKALEAYEQSKWVKFDEYDESTYPQRTGHYITFDWRYVSHKYWNNTGDKRGTNQSWFVSESVNAQKVTHWQPLPEFKE